MWEVARGDPLVVVSYWCFLAAYIWPLLYWCLLICLLF